MIPFKQQDNYAEESCVIMFTVWYVQHIFSFLIFWYNKKKICGDCSSFSGVIIAASNTRTKVQKGYSFNCISVNIYNPMSLNLCLIIHTRTISNPLNYALIFLSVQFTLQNTKIHSNDRVHAEWLCVPLCSKQKMIINSRIIEITADLHFTTRISVFLTPDILSFIV